MKLSGFSFNSQEYGAGMWKMGMEKVPRIPFMFDCGLKHRGNSLMRHGKCIFTAVRLRDRRQSLSIAGACFHLHTLSPGAPESRLMWESRLMRERETHKLVWRRGRRVQGIFVPSEELLSLSFGHTWFHQGARPSFIIDADLFRAD